MWTTRANWFPPTMPYSKLNLNDTPESFAFLFLALVFMIAQAPARGLPQSSGP